MCMRACLRARACTGVSVFQPVYDHLCVWVQGYECEFKLKEVKMMQVSIG